MTARTDRHQVALVKPQVRRVLDLLYVVHMLCWCHAALSFALCAQWMLCPVSLAERAPVMSIATLLGRLLVLLWRVAPDAPLLDNSTTLAQLGHYCVVTTVTFVLLPAFSTTARK